MKDIAAVSGQSARFECIVQCEPHPEITWTKNGEYVQNTCRTVVEYRNGVCRLTIPQAYPGTFYRFKEISKAINVSNFGTFQWTLVNIVVRQTIAWDQPQRQQI